MSPSTTRWCPTPEQLMILEELYRRGLRTPNASQIQKITAHLSFYGKIQGKNVFYWFQNHKARDRQKLRKKIAKQHQINLQHQLHQYQLDPQTRFGTHVLDFHNPLPFLPCSNSYSPENFPHAQGATGLGEETPEGIQNQTWRPDLPKDYLNNISTSIYGYDSMMINMNTGPTFPCCTSTSRAKPLQTLELFPLTATHQESNS